MQVEYVLTLLVAAAVTYLLTPLVRRFAVAAGAIHATRDRDVHQVPTPLLGGVAMYAGLVAGLIVASQLVSVKSVFAQTNMAKGLLPAGWWSSWVSSMTAGGWERSASWPGRSRPG